MKTFLQSLPDEIKGKPLRPFLSACGLDVTKFFPDLPENVTLADLPEYLANNPVDDVALKIFAEEIRFDVRARAKKIVDSLSKTTRESDVVRRRAEGQTLEEIGRDFNVTRERIRQIESKSAKKFRGHRAELRKIIRFLYALNDGKVVLMFDDIKNFLDADDAKIIHFLAEKTDFDNRDFRFDSELDAFIFHNGTTFNMTDLLEGLPDMIDADIFDDTIANLARDKNIPVEAVRIKLSRTYRRSGKIFYRGRLTLVFECGCILRERFPNGYKIADETFYLRFMRYLREIFDEKTPLTQRSVDAKISAIGVLCDRGKYIHPDFVRVPPEIIDRVKNFVDASERIAIPYKEIFEALKNFFVGTQITNHYFLQGAIKLHNLPYTLRKDYLTKSDEIDMGKEFDRFIAEHGEISARELRENFISFTDANINFLVRRCPEVIGVGDGNLIHATHLNLQANDFEPIKNFLRQNCSTPINSRILFDRFFERFADFMTRNDIQNHNKLFGILQYMFRDHFNFSRPYISATDIKNLTNKKILLRLLEDVDEIGLDDVIAICDENRINFVAKSTLIDDLRPDFIRVDEFTLQRPESIGITDEIISAVAENVRSAVERNGGWQSAQTFDDYEWLPQLETPWNSFLLESIVSLADDAICKLKVPSTSTRFSFAIFVAEEFAEYDFQSFLLKILSAEHAKEPFRSEKEIFDWLNARGLCHKKLPKFLEGGKAFDLLNE